MLFDASGVPLPASSVSRPSLDSGTFRGSIANWHPRRVFSQQQATAERAVTARRAEDVYANNWAARSGVTVIADNAIGTGLMPQMAIPWKRLGIDCDAARELQDDMAWEWYFWTREAHASGMAQFEDLQYAALRSILRNGECLHLPVMLDDASRRYAFAIQDVHPSRLATPSDLAADYAIHDGVRLAPNGTPERYYIACPPQWLAAPDVSALSSSMYAYRTARLAHRKNVFHLFRYEEEGQVRGLSSLATGIKLFRNLNDCLDYELFAQIIAASFPVFFAIEGGAANLPPEVMQSYGLDQQAQQPRSYQEVEPGTNLYGAPGEKPYVLESKRPSANFTNFVEIIQRAQAASMGIPYESLTKDFSKTNYSSARAALNEAWAQYRFYRKWFARLYCQPIFEMVMEEAYLQGRLRLPPQAPDWYENRMLYCNAEWIGPARGSVDPVKEIQAVILRLQNNLMTYGEAWSEYGGDFADSLETMREERTALGSLPPATAAGGLRAPNAAAGLESGAPSKGSANAAEDAAMPQEGEGHEEQ